MNTIQEPHDLAARDSALDISQSWIVQAPAGSGKTGILVYRMMKLLAVVQQPEQVLAITFTRKAAKEMRDRLLGLLIKADAGETSEDEFEAIGIQLARAVLENDANQGWQLLNLPHRLNIETIDALCARLVATMPWLSRLGEKPQTTEKPEQHYQFAIEQLLLELLDEDSDIQQDLINLLLSQENNFRKIRNLLQPMLSRRDQWLRHFLGKDLQRSQADLEETWRSISETMLGDLLESIPIGVKEKIVKLAHFSARQRVDLEMQKPPRERNPNKLNFPAKIFIEQQRFPRADFADLDLWLGIREMLLTKKGSDYSLRKQVTKTQGFPTDFPDEKAEFKQLLVDLENAPEFIEKLTNIELIPPPSFNQEQWQQLLMLEKVLRRLLAHLQLRFHNAKECDFTEVSLRANQALDDLGKPTDLALRMDYQIQHILVDEFQDTSHAQFSLLQNLTRGWQKGDGRSLFLVGDPMQSIYRFREADVGLFIKLSERRGKINEIDLKPLVLSENFRSQKSLVDWFNQVFSVSFPKQNNETKGAIVYSPASSHKAEQGKPQFHAFHTEAEEAEHVVSLVNQAIVRQDKKIAILVRKRTQLKHLLPALKAANIIFEGIDIKPLNQTQDVLDIISLCKAIIRLDDKAAWLSLLRGPWVGLSLTDITLLAAGKDAVIWERLLDKTRLAKLSKQAQQRIKKFVKTMQLALLQKQKVPLASLTQWAWQQLGGEYALQQVSQEDLTVVWQLINQLEKGGNIEKITELDQALDGLYAQSDIAASSSKQRVVVSTIHKSKGLQYDTVILPGLARKGANNEKDLLRWAEMVDGYGQDKLLIAALASDEQTNSHYHYLQELEKQRDANEVQRLLYVACTRAEKHLYLSGVFNHTKEGELTARGLKQSLLNGIWSEVKSGFKLEDTPALELQEAQQGRLDQTLYRLPTDFSLPQKTSLNWQASVKLKTKKPEQEIAYEWAGSVAQATGVLLHEWLEKHGDELLQFDIDHKQEQQWQTEFKGMRLEPTQIASAVKRMAVAIHKMKRDAKAQWILSAEHTQVENEYAVSTVDEGVLQHHRIDRTFVDAEGVRWIIDYKSTTHFEQNISEFVDQQIEQREYKEQLERYAKAFNKLENRPIKLGIYFPLLGEWRQWDYTADQA